MASEPALARHWDGAYARGAASRSWFQPAPVLSLRMLDAAGVTAAGSLVDVGGGASLLAAVLLERGFSDLTVLDISAAGMEHARRRLGPRARAVNWVTADIRTWVPPRHFAAWHDRAVFHFLTAARDQRAYLRTLAAATVVNSVAVFGCFAPDGPPRCSGLPVARYAPADLASLLGDDWTLIAHDREAHITPSGQTQPFTWTALRRTC